MAQVGSRSFVAAMVGASLMALAGCGSGAGSITAGGNAPAANAAALGPVANAIQSTQFAAGPTQPASGPTRYCGTIQNMTVNEGEQGEIDVNPGAGFSGTIILNGSTLQGGAGPFQGTTSNGQCSGVSSSGGLSFTGSCPTGGEYDGSYAIQGQQGVFRMSTSACH
jgi:hypothetical protein